MSRLLLIFSMLLPWPLRRWLLIHCLGFAIPKTARIGLSWLGMKKLVMEDYSSIGHFNVFKALDEVTMKECSKIGHLNRFTCVPRANPRHYGHLQDRQTRFSLGRHSAVTMRHLFDCNEAIEIGDFTTIAGYGSQFLTHSIDLVECRQDARPIRIGSYCFISTSCIVLGGAQLPSYCVVGAMSLFRTSEQNERTLYAGVPATPKKELPAHTKYWIRETGWVA